MKKNTTAYPMRYVILKHIHKCNALDFYYYKKRRFYKHNEDFRVKYVFGSYKYIINISF